MMKRKVRIYKDPNGQGGYVNKTAQWLSRADDGLQTGVTPVTAGIMGQMQNAPTQSMQYQQPEQSQEDMMLQEVTGMISKGIDKEEIKLALLAKLQVEQGTPEYSNASAQLDSYLESIYNQLGEEARIDTNEKLNLPTGEFDETVDTVDETPAPNYYNDLAQEDNSNNDANAELDAEGDDISFSRYGGTPSKSAFIKKTLKQLKKAADGQETGEDTGYTATIRGTENKPSKSPGYMDSFIAGIKSQVEEDILRKDAEAMYNNMYGQGMPPQDGDVAEDGDYDQDDMDYAQFGGGAGRRMRRGMRKVFGRGATPPGVTSSKFTYGPLGGVRTADVQFNPLMMMSMFPGMTSGMGGFGYSGGYNSQQNRHSTGRLVTERVAKTINKEAIVEVAGATDGDAPKKAAETVVVNSDGTTTTTKADGTVTTVPTVVTNTKPQSGNKKLNPGDNGYVWQPKVDKWGRPEDSEWYGFNPTTKQYEIEGKGHRWDNVTEPKVNPTLYENYYLKNHDDKGNIKGSPKTLGLDGKYLTEAQRKKIKEDRAKRQKEYDNSNIFSQMWNGNPKFEEDKRRAGELNPSFSPYLMPTGVGALQIPASFGKTFLNSPQKLLGAGQKILHAYGGSINDLSEDPYGNLQQFVYGGDEPIDDSMLENLYQPPINEQDIDYTDSENVTDPYFKRNGGGLYRFQGTGSSQVSGATTPTPFTGITTQEDYDKKLAEEKTKWQTDYDKTLAYKQRQQQYDPRGYMSQQQYGSYGVNQPVWGQPQNSAGRGLFGNLYSPYTRGPNRYSPVGDPLQYAATAAMISKSGMLPTGVKYAKERKQDGNFFEKNLGFNKDKTWTLDYATPEQIKAKAAEAQSFGQLNTSNPVDQTANVPGTTTKEEDIKKFQDSRAAQGMVWNEEKQRWISKDYVAPKGPQPINPAAPTTTVVPVVEEEKPGQGAPYNNVGPIANGMAYGGYMPNDYYAYGGYLPEAGGGLDVSPVSFAGNPIIGLSDSPTWDAMSNFNNQNKDIEGPIDKNKYYNEGPLDNDCTDEDKLDPKSDCYDPQSAQLKIKEQKSGTINYDNIGRGVNLINNTGADAKNYIDERMKVWVPGMTDFAYGEKEKANEAVNRGPFDARTGREGISGFEGVIKRGGSIGYKKGGEYRLTRQDIEDLMRDGGLVEFLD
tara:strand:+ start:459 stop:3938 length:3480 start_codon:yes stop_codon:yes gene_type:complete